MNRSSYMSDRDRASSRGNSAARSRSPRTERVEEPDSAIRHLKRELASLRSNTTGFIEIKGKLSNLEHRYELLVQDKNQETEKARIKDHQLDVEISEATEDLRNARERLDAKEKDVAELKNAFLKLEKIVEAKEDEIHKQEQGVKAVMEEVEKLERLRGEFEYEKGNIINDQLKCNTLYNGTTKDIEMITENLTTKRRTLRDIKSKIIDMNSHTNSLIKESNGLLQDLASLGGTQRSKESQLKRLREKVAALEGDLEMMGKEKNSLIDLYSSRDDVFKALIDTKTDLSRSEAKLVKDKIAVDAQISELEKEINIRRSKVNEQEAEKQQKDHDLRSLKKVYERLVEDNKKLVEILQTADQMDQKVFRDLTRVDKIDNILVEANKEITASLENIRG